MHRRIITETIPKLKLVQSTPRYIGNFEATLYKRCNWESIKDDKEANKVIEIMENAVTLEVPNKVDYESGDTWGDIYD